MAVCRGLIRNGAFEWLFMAGNSDWPPSSLVAYISTAWPLRCRVAFILGTLRALAAIRTATTGNILLRSERGNAGRYCMRLTSLLYINDHL
jgi:hypothetical protein